MKEGLSENAKLLLLTALLAKDRIISQNGASFLKELILRRDPRVRILLSRFESQSKGDATFLDKINDLIEEESFSFYNECFSRCTLEMGKTLSKEERNQKALNEEKSLIYGEVDYHSFFRVLRKINPKKGGTFYDLGSGTGKAVLAARFTRDFSRCIGIEILQGLHKAAVTVVNRFEREFRKYLNSSQKQQAAVYEGSFLEFDWSDGDLVFANSTCFEDALMKQMAKQAENLKPGAIFVTFTKGLVSSKFEVLERKRYKMSWGPATVFIHRRLNPDGSSVGPANLNILPSDNEDFTDDINKPDSVSNSTSWRNEYDDDEDDDDDDEEEEEEEEEEEDSEDYNDVKERPGNWWDVEDVSEDDEDDDTVETENSGLMVQGNAAKIHRAPPAVNDPQSNPFRYEDLHETMSPEKCDDRYSSPKKSPSRLDVAQSPTIYNHDNILNSPQDSALLQRKRAALSNDRTFFA